MAEQRTHVPEWLVERLAAGELEPEQARTVRAQLEQAGALGRLDAIRTSNRRILEQHPPAEIVREIERRLSVAPDLPRVRARKRWSLAAPGLAIACATALSALVLLVDPEAPPQDVEGKAAPANTVRLKGLEPHLVAYKKTSSGVVRLEQARVAPGDLIQLAYVATGRLYGVVASIDSAGTVTLHLPEQSGAARPLAPRRETALPRSFELDDVPGTERFVFVTSDQPFSTRAVVEFLSAQKPLPPGLQATELSLEKNLP